jgi:hypothetical protein
MGPLPFAVPGSPACPHADNSTAMIVAAAQSGAGRAVFLPRWSGFRYVFIVHHYAHVPGIFNLPRLFLCGMISAAKNP